MCSCRFLCDECNGLKLQTKECDLTRRWFHSQQVEVVWYTSTWHIFVVMDDITGIGWLHQHGKNYWLYTGRYVFTMCVNERQYRNHNFIYPSINDSTPRIQWSFMNTQFNTWKHVIFIIKETTEWKSFIEEWYHRSWLQDDD